MKQSVYCLAKNPQQATHIIHDLHKARISDDAISVIYADENKSVTDLRERDGQKQRRRSSKDEHKPGKKVRARTNDESLKTMQEQDAPHAHFTLEKGTKSAEGAVTGAATGGLIGGAIGLLAGLGTIALPGALPLLAAGPILSALSGMAVGSLSGGLAGSLSAAKIPEYYVAKASDAIEEGRVLIAVATDDDDQANKVCAIFEKDGASDVSSVAN